MSTPAAGLSTRPAPRTAPVAGRRALRAGPVSAVWRPRAVAVVAAGGLALAVAAALSLALGDYPLPLGQVVATLLGRGDTAGTFIVLELRLPRTVTGLLVGAALGVAGALTQTVARNPLASPDVLGVTAGAGVAAVAVIVLAGQATGGEATASGLLAVLGLPAAALVGGLGTAALVYLLAWRPRSEGPSVEGYRLVLVGVGLGAVATALTSWLLVRAEISAAAAATVWLTGSLNGRGWEQAVPVAATVAVAVPVALAYAARLDVLQLGEDTARALGARVDRDRTVLVVLAVALAAVATAAAGPIAFVALVVPQICLRLLRTARPPLLASAVGGALLVTVSDLLARTALGVELPVGIVTAVLGAPYLLYLLVRRNRAVVG